MFLLYTWKKKVTVRTSVESTPCLCSPVITCTVLQKTTTFNATLGWSVITLAGVSWAPVDMWQARHRWSPGTRTQWLYPLAGSLMRGQEASGRGNLLYYCLPVSEPGGSIRDKRLSTKKDLNTKCREKKNVEEGLAKERWAAWSICPAKRTSSIVQTIYIYWI